MSHSYGLIGVPSSAGAHWPGQEKAPGYLRAAGLIQQLSSAGLDLTDYGDLPLIRFYPDAAQRRPHNLAAVTKVAKTLARRVQAVLQAGQIPLVIGGDCSISIGVVSGLLPNQEDLALLYLDGGVDLFTPETDPTGILDSMGVAHMIGEPGTAEFLSHIGPRYPLLSPDKVVFFGPDLDTTTEPERTVYERHRMALYPSSQVQAQAARVAAEARADVEGRGAGFLVHFDVDSIDFMDFPIADVPLINAGITFQEAMESLAIFTASPKFAGLVITEFNPDHADEAGALGQTFVQGLARALAGSRRPD